MIDCDLLGVDVIIEFILLNVFAETGGVGCAHNEPTGSLALTTSALVLLVTFVPQMSEVTKSCERTILRPVDPIEPALLFDIGDVAIAVGLSQMLLMILLLLLTGDCVCGGVCQIELNESFLLINEACDILELGFSHKLDGLDDDVVDEADDNDECFGCCNCSR